MTMGSLSHYEQFAALFDYPDADYPTKVRAARRSVPDDCPVAATRLGAFAEALPSAPGMLAPDAVAEMQEIFTRSFDVQAITTLSVGYLLFGDDYKRGELLANLNREQRDAGVDCGRELSDHLPNVLRLMARWQDQALVAELVDEIVRPAVGRMIAEFGPERMEQRSSLYARHFRTLIASSAERGTIFREPLAALAAVLDRDFPGTARKRPEEDNDFLRSIGRELDIEANEGRPTPSGRMP
jgi:nitrate reductase assembly molybdenum cofactor insertion protein NarJ